MWVRSSNGLVRMLCLGALLSSSLLATAQSLETGGFALGASLTQAKAKLTGYRQGAMRMRNPKEESLIAWRGHESWSFLGISDHIVFIMHRLEYRDPSTPSPSYSGAQQQLLEKYGGGAEATYHSSGKLVFEYDPSGVLLHSFRKDCDPSEEGLTGLANNIPSNEALGAENIWLPGQFNGSCGKEVYADFAVSGANGISGFEIVLEDQAALFREAQQFAIADKAARDATQQKQDAARPKAPF